MAEPICGNNPAKRACSDGTRLAIHRVYGLTTIKQRKDNSTTLRTGNHEVALRKRTRAFDVKFEYSSTIPESAFICQSTFGSGAYHVYDPDAVINTDIREFKEDYMTVDSKIIYLDIRHDFVIHEEETDKMKFDGVQKPDIQWIANGVSSAKHVYAVPLDVEIDVDEKSIVGSAVEATKLTPYGLDWGQDLYIAFPWSAGTPKNNVPEDYLLYDIGTRNEFGGNNFYHPRWIQPLGVDHTDDEMEKQYHLDIIDDLDLSGTEDGDYEVMPPVNTAVKGSAAYDTSGNLFYSYKAVNGGGKSKLMVDGEAVDIPTEVATNVDGNKTTLTHTAFYPIAPL